MLPSLKDFLLLAGLAAVLGPIGVRGEIPYQIPVPNDLILLPAYYFELQAPMTGGFDPTALIGNYFGVADDPDQPFETREKPSNTDPDLQQGSGRAAVYIPPGGAGVWCWHALASGLSDLSDSFYWQMEGYEPEVFQLPYHMGIDSADKFRAWDGSYDWQWMPVQDASVPGPKCYDLAEGYHSLRLVYQEPGAYISAVAGVKQGAAVSLPLPEIVLSGEVEEACTLAGEMQLIPHPQASGGFYVGGVEDVPNPMPYEFRDYASCPFTLNSPRYLSAAVRVAACDDRNDESWFVLATQDRLLAPHTPWALGAFSGGCPDGEMKFRWEPVTHRPEASRNGRGHQWWVADGNQEFVINQREAVALDRLVLYSSGDCLGPWQEDGAPGLCIPPYPLRNGEEPVFLRVYADPNPDLVYQDGLPDSLGYEASRRFETPPGQAPLLLAEVPYGQLPFRERVLLVTFQREDLLSYATQWGGACLAHEAVYADPNSPDGWATSARSPFQCYLKP